MSEGRIVLGATSLVAGLTGAAAAAMERLRAFDATLEELIDVAAVDGVAAIAALHYALHELAVRGLLRWRAIGASGPLVTASLEPRPYRGDPRLSRFALLRRVGERMIIETALSAAEVEVHSPAVLALIAGLPSTLAEGEIAAVGSLLEGCGVLASADGEPALRFWEFHDLLFHARSRIGRSRARHGGTYRFRGTLDPLPLVKPTMSADFVDLPVPDLQRLRRDDPTLTAVLEDRRSIRQFGDPPISLEQIGELLYRTARERNGGRRIAPAAGALYELELYLTVGSSADLARGLYHYTPREHRLYRLPAADVRISALLADAGGSMGAAAPQLLITLAARFARVFWKYESLGYALILKDTGVLLQTICLAAQAMGLGACAIGAGDSELFAAAAGLAYHAETSVGEVVVGTVGREC